MRPRIRLTARDRRVRNRKYRRAVEMHARALWRFYDGVYAAACAREHAFWALVTGSA